jgi:hypothetical protein
MEQFSKHPTNANFDSLTCQPKPESDTFSKSSKNHYSQSLYSVIAAVKSTSQKHNVTIELHHQMLLTGYSKQHTGLWRVQLSDTATDRTPTGQANSVLPTGTIADTVQFLHKASFSPSTSRFIKAIDKGNFATWPMLTSENVKKYLPKSEATAMGHLD